MSFQKKNADMEGILFLLQQVEQKTITAKQCLKRLCQCYGGYLVYFPSLNRKKVQIVKACQAAGLTSREAARKAGVSLRWANRIYRACREQTHKQGPGA
jgi:hypothetical protein